MDALVAELAYARGLEPRPEKVGGSNPPEGTKILIPSSCMEASMNFLKFFIC